MAPAPAPFFSYLIDTLLSAFWEAPKEGKSRVLGSPFPLQTQLTPLASTEKPVGMLSRVPR